MKEILIIYNRIILISLICIPLNGSAQNVGVGTTTPAYKLDVKNGSINTDSLYRINGLTVLSLPGTGNVFVGKQNGLINTGTYNTFVGESAGISNSTGSLNSFLGSYAGAQNSNGTFNSFFGYSAGYSNNTATNNSFFGTYAGMGTSTGSNNCFFGRSAGILNTVGHDNIAIGRDALYSNTNQSRTIAIGDSALFSQDGVPAKLVNVAIGSKAGFSNTLGYANVFVGDSSGYYNGFGLANTFIGSQSGVNIGSGSYCTFNGYQTGNKNSGSFNTFFGAQAGTNNTVGTYNCFVGLTAGNTNTTGNSLTMLGTNANPIGSNLTKAVAIGYNASVSCSNCLVLGGTISGGDQTRVGINTIAPQTDLHIIQQSSANFDNTRGIRLQSPNGNYWRVFLDPSNNYVYQYTSGLFSYIEPVGGTFVSNSDERLKKDIAPLAPVLDKLLLLQPKFYHYIASADANRYSYGFIAQEVEKLFPDFVFSSEDGIKGIAYSNFSVIAVKAIQEQQLIINDQKQKIDELHQQMQEVLKELSELRGKKTDQ